MNALVNFFKSKYLYLSILMYLLGDFFLGGPLKEKGLFSYIYLYFGKFSFLLGGLLFFNIILSFVRGPKKKDIFSINIEFIMILALSCVYFLFMLKMQVPFTKEVASDEVLKKGINISTFEYNCGQVPSFLFYLLLSKFPYLYVYILLGAMFLVSSIIVVFVPFIRRIINYYRQEKVEIEREKKTMKLKEQVIVPKDVRGKTVQKAASVQIERTNISLSIEEIEELTKQAINNNGSTTKTSKKDTKERETKQNDFINQLRKTTVQKEKKIVVPPKPKKETSVKTVKLDALFEDLIKENNSVTSGGVFNKEKPQEKVKEKIQEKTMEENEKKSTFTQKKESIISGELKTKKEDIFESRFKKAEEALKTSKESIERVKSSPKDIYEPEDEKEIFTVSKNAKIISISEYLKLNEKEEKKIEIKKFNKK